MADTWEVRKDGQAYAGGPMETMPSAEQRRSMRAAGYQIYVDGRLQRDPAGKKVLRAVAELSPGEEVVACWDTSSGAR